MTVLPLLGDVLRSAWPWVCAHLSRRELPYTSDELLAMAEAGHLTVWAVMDGEPVSLVMLAKYADGKGEIVYASGEMRCLPVVMDAAVKWCEWNNVEILTVDGRKGWRRVLKQYGFKREASRWALARNSRR